jgi:hypothetical protein
MLPAAGQLGVGRMKKLHTFDHADRVQLELLKDLLSHGGVEYLVKGEHMSTAAGGIPFTECYPEVWVMNDGEFPRALKIRDAWLRPAEAARPWRCDNCGEHVDGQFDLCWKCEALRPEDSLIV